MGNVFNSEDLSFVSAGLSIGFHFLSQAISRNLTLWDVEMAWGVEGGKSEYS